MTHGKKQQTLSTITNMMGLNARTGLRAGEGCKEVFIVLLVEPDPLEKLSSVSVDSSSPQSQ